MNYPLQTSRLQWGLESETYIQVGLTKLCGLNVLIIGGSRNKDGREVLVGNAEKFLILEQIAIDRRLVQETAKTDSASRIWIGSVTTNIVKLFQARRSDGSRASGIDRGLGRSGVLFHEGSCRGLHESALAPSI